MSLMDSHACALIFCSHTNEYTAVIKYLVWDRLLSLKDEPTQSLQLPSCAAGHIFYLWLSLYALTHVCGSNIIATIEKKCFW